MSILTWFTIFGGAKVANWMMMQALDNTLYSQNTKPQIIGLSNGSVATLASHQVQSTGSSDRNCLSIVDSSGRVVANKNLGGNVGSSTPNFMHNSGSNTTIYHGRTVLGGTQFFSAALDTSAYTYGAAVYYDDASTTWQMENARTRSGKPTTGMGGGYVAKFDAGTVTQTIPGHNTGTWQNPDTTGQVDVDGSNNLSFCLRSAASGANVLLFGRITGASYNAYSFWNPGVTTYNRPKLCMRANDTAVIAVNETAAVVRLFELSATPAMTRHFTYTVAGTLDVIAAAIDPDDSDVVFMLCKTATVNQLILMKVSISTGAIAYQKSLVFTGWSGINEFQMHVYSGCIYIAGQSTNFSASRSPIDFFAKLDKATLTNATYTVPGISGSYGEVVVSTYGTTITVASQSTSALTTVPLTRGTNNSATAATNGGQQGYDFFNSATVTVS